jgi:hypothetical protein
MLPLPVAMKTGPMAPVVKIAGALGLGALAGMVTNRRMANQVAAGAVTVEVTVPGEVAKADAVSVSGVRYAWERYPQCSLYDGYGGWDHGEDAIAATPFCYDVEKDAPCPPTKIPNP